MYCKENDHERSVGLSGDAPHVIITCTPLRFFSPVDEDMLFAWLARIPSIQKVQGIGRVLELHMSSKNIPYDDAWNLRGVFKRYGFETQQQLLVFINEKNKHLFDDL